MNLNKFNPPTKPNHMHKYRGKRLDGGGWVVGSLFTCIGVVAPYHEHCSSKVDYAWILISKVPRFVGYTVNDLFTSHEVDPATVGQATGLKDKEGNEIYEGDVLEEDGKRYSKYEVVWDGKRAKFRLDWQRISTAVQYPEWNRGVYMEIIGNIHDNPDLLTTKTTNNGMEKS